MTASAYPNPNHKRFARIPKSGAWLTIFLSCWHGTLLSCDKWHHNIRLRYLRHGALWALHGSVAKLADW